MSSTCPACGQIIGYGHKMPDIEAGYSNGKVFRTGNTLGEALLNTFGGKAIKYTEADLKQAKLEGLDELKLAIASEINGSFPNNSQRRESQLIMNVCKIFNIYKQQIESE